MYFAHLSEQYSEPKWKAVVPQTSALRIGDNLQVRNLWELKQALHELEEEYVGNWLHNEHHIAEWVRNAVGHLSLAEHLEKQRTKWGLIVHLEQEMMRTLHLPRYVASRWLEKASHPFLLRDGREVWYIKQLPELVVSESELVKPHFEKSPSDFSVWSEDSFGNYVLADLLRSPTSLEDILERLRSHIWELEEASED